MGAQEPGCPCAQHYHLLFGAHYRNPFPRERSLTLGERFRSVSSERVRCLVLRHDVVIADRLVLQDRKPAPDSQRSQTIFMQALKTSILHQLTLRWTSRDVSPTVYGYFWRFGVQSGRSLYYRPPATRAGPSSGFRLYHQQRERTRRPPGFSGPAPRLTVLGTTIEPPLPP